MKTKKGVKIERKAGDGKDISEVDETSVFEGRDDVVLVFVSPDTNNCTGN